MKVKELIALLKGMDKEAEVVFEKGNNDGCDTCGYGETSSSESITSVVDLETRVVLSAD